MPFDEPFDALSTISMTTIDTSDLITRAFQQQAAGVGGSGGDYQTVTEIDLAPTLLDGFLISRVISNFNVSLDTKTGIVSEFGLGGWPLHEDVQGLNGINSVEVPSASNLSVSTIYTNINFWISSAYYQRVFIDGTHTLSDAINNTAGDSGITVWPAGDAVYASNDVTIVGTTSPATNIAFNGTVTAGAAALTVIGIATANRSNGTFSEGTPSLSWVTVASNGLLTVSSGQVAPTPGSYTIQLVYDNSGVTGGGVYTQNVTVTVLAASAGVESALPAPTVNVNSSGQNLTVQQYKDLLDDFASNWASTCTSLGIATTGVDPVLTLATGELGDFIVSNKGPFTDGSNPRFVHVRGTGTFSRDSYTPTCGTRLRQFLITNCEHLRFWLLYANNPGGTTNPVHGIVDCDDIGLYRACMNGDVRTSASGVAQDVNTVAKSFSIAGSTNITYRHIVAQGFRNAIWFMDGTGVASNHVWSEILVGQLAGDLWNMGGNSVQTNFSIKNVYGTGPTRNIGTGHTDFWQTQGNAITDGLVVENVYGSWWENYGYTYGWGMKFFQKANDAQMRNVTVSQILMGNGSNLWSGVNFVNRSCTHCSYIPNADILNSDHDKGGQNWRAGWGGVNSGDFHFALSHTASNSGQVGPNGIQSTNGGYTAADNGSYNWNPLATYLVDFSAPSGSPATTARTSAKPRSSIKSMGQRVPVLGSGLHWDDTNPKGAWRFLRTLHHPTEWDNAWGWGWPCCCMMAITYDAEQLCSGAGANSNGTVFDANGD